MKHTLSILIISIALFFAGNTQAQETEKGGTPRRSVTLTNKGIFFDKSDSAEKTMSLVSKRDSVRLDKHENKRVTTCFFMDLGVNILKDNTNYADPNVQSFLNVRSNMQNSNLFELRNSKSINVNIYPVMVKYMALKTPGQRIYVSTGLGLQLYNFRYEQPITYTKNPAGIFFDSSMSFKKNKLSLDYLNVPLMLTFKTRIHKDPKGRHKKDTWLVYGAGITEGFRLDSWTKQVSGTNGKVKSHGNFGLADFNTCVTAEFGIDGLFRLYGSYQLTSMYENGIDQHPVSFGVRFCGL